MLAVKEDAEEFVDNIKDGEEVCQTVNFINT